MLKLLCFLVVVALYDVSTADNNVLSRVRRLIGGKEVPEGRPEVAVLAWKNTGGTALEPYFVVCTAVVLSANWILSNAHCRDPLTTPMRQNENMFIVLGLQDNSWGADQSNVQEFAIDGINVKDYIHPDYHTSPVLMNDIALMKIHQGAILNEFVKAIELPPEDIDDKKKTTCTIYSWGVTSEPVTEESFSRHLKTGTMSLNKFSQCQEYFFDYLGNDHLCATGKKGVTPCFGDSGSPLFCKSKKNTYFFGIDSFGRRPACQGTPIQVFVRIKVFVEWIKNIMVL